MIRIVPPPCGSCKAAGQFQLDCGAILCWPCVRDWLAILHDMNLMANPIAAELVHGIGQRVNQTNHPGWMIWGIGNNRGTPFHFVSESAIKY